MFLFQEKELDPVMTKTFEVMRDKGICTAKMAKCVFPTVQRGSVAFSKCVLGFPSQSTTTLSKVLLLWLLRVWQLPASYVFASQSPEQELSGVL